MIMESVMDFSSTNSSSNASSPRGDTSPSVKQAQPPTSSPPLTPPRDATPTNNNNINNNNNNNNNNNINSKELEGPMALIQSHAPHGGPHGPMGPHGPPHGAPHGPPHPMAPPHPMSPMRHLGPPGLGLFNSLMGSPLEFMAAAQAQAQAQAQHGHQGHPGHPQHPGGHPHPPRSYNSPPPISSSDPTANECKLVNYRGQKVAAFMINGETMLCLPQAFELFLKHLVGGLHTVYTKLKRLDIVPLVCNVEQVRILRGLGAIQPGVNRCKLLSCKDFDSLYRDCTTASRPGRPTKRVSMGLALPASLQGHPQIKKHRLENGDMFENGHLGGPDKSPLLSNGYNAPPSHLQAMQQLYQHPLLSPGLPPGMPPLPGGPGQHQHPAGGGGVPPHPALHPAMPPGKPPPGLPGMEAISNWETCRAAYEDIVKHLERIQQERGEAEAIDNRPRDLTSHNGSPNGHSPVLNLSKGGGSGGGAGSQSGPSSHADHSDSDACASDKDDDDDDAISNPEDDDEAQPTDLTDGHSTRVGSSPPAGSPPPYGTGAGALGAAAVGSAAVDLAAGSGGGGGASDEEGGGSSGGGSAGGGAGTCALGTIALLRNIQRLLKVAAENARAQEQQVDLDRVLWQKRLQKERKARRRLQEQLELEMKRRAQLEEALRGAVGSDVLARELDPDRKPGEQPKQEPQPQDSTQVHNKQGSTSPQPNQPNQPPHPMQGHQIQLLHQPQQLQHNQQQKHQQTSPVPDRERQSPAILDTRSNFYKNSVLFGGAS
ncbi:dachshund homolog 1-like isoform X2 [Frankliniella occidentalis]|uniref:Dachshund homolog 1-like isoform X2 n=1 Tax=Frankliniella occidentalis TaxID=133901 RepID=A0A9C6WNF6_FRAOC|nr:dachshund homolog 1-like isoform X2 [Frankliniella occidentalis]